MTKEEWRPFQKSAVAIAPFVADPADKHQASLAIGDIVQIEEEFRGEWYRGLILSQNQKGIFPCSFVKLRSEEVDLVVNELTQVLREWGELFEKLYMERRMKEFYDLKERMDQLLEWHHKIKSSGTTETRRRELKEKVIAKIEEGRRQMGLDMMVRTSSGEPATEENTGIVQLYRMHQELAAKDRADEIHEGKFISKNKSVEADYQLLLDLKILMCPVGEPTELYFSLYHRSSNSFVTEEFQVLLTGNGMPFDVEKIGKIKSLFLDLPVNIMTDDLYLVCKIIRRGKILIDNKKEKKPNELRRPFGCSVLALDSDLRASIMKKEKEITIPIYAPSPENNFGNLHELIIKKNGGYQDIPKANGICIALELLRGDLENVLQQRPELRSIDKTKRIQFPDVILPGTERNDLYLTLEGGEFSQERKTSAKNVEVTLQVRRENGEQVKDCIYSGNSEKGRNEYHSFVIYHSNSPIWNERIRITMPPRYFENCHLHFTIKHCSTTKKDKPFAQAYIPLTNSDGTVTHDGAHSLECFKHPKTDTDTVFYMKETRVPKKGDNLRIRTLLVSTKLTQNKSMLSLLKWKHAENLGDVLKKITYVDTTEISKFLQETFDAMFSILEQKAQGIDILVYDALVFVIGNLVDEKKKTSARYRAVLDEYIKNHFNGNMAHKHLMKCLHRVLESIDPKSISKIIPTLKALEYILKFIIASRLLFNKSQNSGENVWFKKDLNDVFSSFEQLMKYTSREFNGPQTMALKNFSTIFNDLSEIFDMKELSSIACKFIEAIQYSEQLKLLNREKLHLIEKIVLGELFVHKESRNELFPIIIKQLKSHLNKSVEELWQCSSILNAIIDSVQNKIKDSQSVQPLLSLLPIIIDSVHGEKVIGIPTLRLDLVTCLLSVFYLMEENQFLNFLEEKPDKYEFSVVLTRMLRDFLSSARTYPENWFMLCMFQFKTIKKVIGFITKVLKEVSNKITEPDPNVYKHLWIEFFYLCIIFIKSSGLALEKFPESKKTLIKESTGDMRVDVSNIFKNMWDSLGKNQILFLEKAVGPFLEIMLIQQLEIRKAAACLYFSLLQVEFSHSKSFARVTSQTIQTLDKIVNNNQADENFKDFLIANLEAQFKNNKEMLSKGQQFLNDIKQVLSLLIKRNIALHSGYDEERSAATLDLMEYLKQTNRITQFVHYAHVLAEQHKAIGNYAEAGFSLLLHAEQLDWKDDILEEEGDFPTESQRQRKQKLYTEAIELFEKGKLYERCIDLLSELRVEYEEVLFDYGQLANTLRNEAKLFKLIATEERFFPPYFRVGFYGKGFDPSLRGKAYVYRGFELERLADFSQRINDRYPNASLLTTTDQPGDDITNSNGQYLQVFLVKPSSKDVMEGKEQEVNRSMPSSTQKYHLENNIDIFCYSKPLKNTSSSSSGNEFKDLWICNFYYKTKEKFPTVKRVSEIVEVTTKKSSPIENAIKSLNEKNNELLDIIAKNETGQETNTSSFTMVLKGVIDAGVNGGVKNYNDAFFSEEYKREDPTSVKKLQAALQNQLEILEKGLKIHEKICPEELKELQETLNSRFTQMKEELKSNL